MCIKVHNSCTLLTLNQATVYNKELPILETNSLPENIFFAWEHYHLRKLKPKQLKNGTASTLFFLASKEILLKLIVPLNFKNTAFLLFLVEFVVDDDTGLV